MARFAILTGSTVTAVAIAGVAMDAAWIPIPPGSNAGPGWTWNGAAFVAPPVAVVEAPVFHKIRFQACLDRMTLAEAIAYELAKVIDPAAPLAQRRDAARWIVRERALQAIGSFRLANARLVNFFNDLEGSVLAVGRAAVILSAPILEDEAG